MTRFPDPSCAALAGSSVYHSSSSLPQPRMPASVPSPSAWDQRAGSGGVPAGPSNSSAHQSALPGGGDASVAGTDGDPTTGWPVVGEGSSADATAAPPMSDRNVTRATERRSATHGAREAADDVPLEEQEQDHHRQREDDHGCREQG